MFVNHFLRVAWHQKVMLLINQDNLRPKLHVYVGLVPHVILLKEMINKWLKDI